MKAFADSVKGAEIHAAEVVPGRTGIDIRRVRRRSGRRPARSPRLLARAGLLGSTTRARGPCSTAERYGVHPRTPIQGGEWFSLEFRTRTAVPEWGNQLVSMFREEDNVIPKSGPLKYNAGPQMELWVIR